MSQQISPLAGKPAPASILVDIGKLLAAYAAVKPDPSVPAQRVAFGTSGHRGSSFDGSFNERHILAITQAICDYRRSKGSDGPLFIGADTHALSQPAFESALEVLAANGVATMVSAGGEFTPTPAVSHAILVHNRGRSAGLADGIVITPSHNPPADGGFKYNPSNGGPADTDITKWVEGRANALLENGLKGVKRMPFAQALKAATTREHDFLAEYVGGLADIVDFAAIRGAGVRLGVDPLGGAGVHYWAAIAERHRIAIDVLSETVELCRALDREVKLPAARLVVNRFPAELAPEAWDQTRALIARGGPEADAAKELLRVMDARHTAREETMTILEQLKPERGAHVPSKLLFPESLEDLGASDVATWLEARGAA